MSRWLNGISRHALLVSLAASTVPLPVFAASFTVSNGQTVGTQTVVGTDTGTIEAGGTVSATTGITWTVNGSNRSPAPGVTIDNSGTIIGSTRGIDTSGSSVPRNITVWNRAGATITGTGNDAFRINGDIGNGSVTVYNYGTILSNGGQALDFDAITSTTGTVNIFNYATGIIKATTADAIRPARAAL